MQFYIDTADIEEIRQANKRGWVDGVTTNPTLVAETALYPRTSGIHAGIKPNIRAESISATCRGKFIAWPAERMFKNMEKAGAKIPILYSANMSMGIAALSAMLSCLQPLSNWDFQIEEAHHNQKKDKPSGTALLLQRELEKVLGRKVPEPNAVRGGGIPGIHQVWVMGEDEALTLQHTAFNRKVFARGAVNAARWLFDKKQPGFYELSDLYK